jgi:preprotein translocase subunit SecG
MLTFGIYFITAIMVLDCLFLILLVLVQLPKKEAGMGQAFGGGATDALFGAGSGNVLTKTTKWGAGIFFVLAIMLTIMGTMKTSGGGGRLQKLMNQNKPAAPATVVAPSNTAAAPTAKPIDLNIPKITPAPETNAIVPVPNTNPPAPAAK